MTEASDTLDATDEEPYEPDFNSRRTIQPLEDAASYMDQNASAMSTRHAKNNRPQKLLFPGHQTSSAQIAAQQRRLTDKKQLKNQLSPYPAA